MVSNKKINEVFYKSYFMELFEDLCNNFQESGNTNLAAKMQFISDLHDVASEVKVGLSMSRKITFKLDDDEIDELNVIMNDVITFIATKI